MRLIAWWSACISVLVLILWTLAYCSQASARTRHHHKHHHHKVHHHHARHSAALHRPSTDEVARLSWMGLASYYHEGQRVACGGGRFDPSGLTAAHPWLACGTVVRVTSERNGRQVEVTINDRGPARWTHRIIDMSRGAGEALGMIRAGVVPVTVEIISLPRRPPAAGHI
jgi:rare lipoprotein A